MPDHDWTRLDSDSLLMVAVLALEDDALRPDEVATVLRRGGSHSSDGTLWAEGRVRRALARLGAEGYLEAVGSEWALGTENRAPVLATLRSLDPQRLRPLARRLASDTLAHSWEVSTILLGLGLAVIAEDPQLVDAAWDRLDLETDDPQFHPSDALTAPNLAHLSTLVQHALVTGAWSQFLPERRLWLVQRLAVGAVWYGRIPGALPVTLAANEASPEVRQALADWDAVGLLVAGDLDGALAAASGPSDTQRAVALLVRWLGGDQDRAMADLDRLLARRAQRQESRFEALVPGPLFAFTACLALAQGRVPTSRLRSWAAECDPEHEGVARILWAAFRHQGKSDAAELYRADVAKVSPVSDLDRLLVHWGAVWNGSGVGQLENQPRVVAPLDEFLTRGALWYAAEEARTLERRLQSVAGFEALLARAGRLAGLSCPFGDLVDVGAAWESSLKRLEDLKFAPPPLETDQEVVVWLVDPHRGEVEPGLRRRLKHGGWSAVKKAPLTRLAKGDHPALRTEDREATQAIVQGYYGWTLDHKRALESLAGHPRLFLTDGVTPLVLDAAEVELQVDETPRGLTFRLAPEPDPDRALLTKVAADHWRVTVVTDPVRKVSAVVGKGLVVPAAARQRVVELLGTLATGLTVRSPLWKENPSATTLVADPRPVVTMVRFEEGVSLDVHVRPLGAGTTLLRPGEGPDQVHAMVGTGLVTASRDRDAERRAWAAVCDLCPNLDAALGGGWSVQAPEPSLALDLLAELRDAGEAVAVEWPKGGGLKVHRQVGVGALSLRVTRDRQWFTVGGGVTLDDHKVVEFRQLLAQNSPGRFVRLADGDWVELEAHLVRQLQHLRNVGEATDEGLRIPPLALAGSELLLDEERVSGEPEVEGWRRRWKSGVQAEPEVPTTVTAELRPYQLEGFRWLARLAELGVGACLADDMGLGKTLQSIALLAHRASRGPSLVVAPTSVVSNWATEIRRFDRALEPLVLGDVPRSDRRALVQGLGPGQVLLVTYGLVVTEVALLARHGWNVVVLDEAQAVKNFHAQRTQAVLSFKADFRLAVTGTPLQNHLGELWTLFEFLNPGLLGTKDSFADRFWLAIEAKKDEGARRALQGLIRPFLLRRTKGQVLAELPEKTETTLTVELSESERAFYEALRRRALDQLAGSATKNAGEQKILVLSHLMKLRRACCHPVLAGGPDAPSSSKLELLEALLEGLMDNGHRTLVFSQFTDHLALIRARLEARGWAYESLDGATPPRDRSASVARFQAGAVPVFLISLQAGGTGLNLTAADDVVHMDPWWNPAVEDQASDRAHRLGQQRPVTIYRLVARDTIEERIVALHASKRSLADALLEGTDAATRMGTQDLVELLAGGPSAGP